jgi:hypothetical protein
MNVLPGYNVWIIAGEVVLLAVVITVMVVLRRRSKKADLQRMQVAEILRDNALDDALKNVYASDEKVEELKKSEPLQVAFHDPQEVSPRGVLVQIEVEAALSTRRYLFDIKDKISIGGSEKNRLVLEDADVDDVLCHLIMQNNQVYVKSISPREGLCIHRNGHMLPLSDQLLAIADGDLLMAGNDRLHLNLISVGEGVSD